MEPERDEVTGKLTTGHVWDGIKELNTPMPTGVAWIYRLAVLWAFVMWILMPAWPYVTDYTRGVLGYHQRVSVTNQVSAAKQERSEWESKLANFSYSDIKADADLQKLAIAAGSATFANNCGVCHGFDAKGQAKFPNLTDTNWLWGGSIEAIEQTIRFGINASHDDTRTGGMPALGKDGALEHAQLKDVVEYVRSLSGLEHDADSAARGAPVFVDTCESCHGEKGTGSFETGAPNLTDQVWLFGSDRATLWQTVFYGRTGVMPNWEERLDPPTIKALAIYVHGLGGGMPSKN
ncbi:MAG: cytochrome-c oxidase, cbb3-type subunit III [Proteobacteria bacterium]|nr:cytochrome-c oxidase, cbb3-type subunit III [Pseudomonadota bacterium]